MGLGIFSSGSEEVVVYDPRNPDPFRFTIERTFSLTFGPASDEVVTMAWVNYPNCTNFEGNKIIVWIGKSFEEIRGLKKLDPHFLPTSSIVARFLPTEEGWELGRAFLQFYSEMRR